MERTVVSIKEPILNETARRIYAASFIKYFLMRYPVEYSLIIWNSHSFTHFFNRQNVAQNGHACRLMRLNEKNKKVFYAPITDYHDALVIPDKFKVNKPTAFVRDVRFANKDNAYCSAFSFSSSKQKEKEGYNK